MPLTLDGTLTLSFAGGFENFVTNADTFTIFLSNMDWVGAFDNIASGSRLATDDGFGSFIVNYGAGSPFGTQNVVLSNAIVIPEPSFSSLLLLGLAALGLLRRRVAG